MGPQPVDTEQVAIRQPARVEGAPLGVVNLLQTRPLEFRWHGRGGQGAVTASRVLAEAALRGGLYPQSLPDFGAERSGAPLAVYTRVSRQAFWERGHVSEPDVVVVLDPTLLRKVDVLMGVRGGGALVVNTTMPPSALRHHLPGPYRLTCTVDGTAVALQLLERNLPNIPVLGALIRAIPLLSLELMKGALREHFGLRFPKALLEANLQALERGYSEASIEGELWL